MFNKIWSNLFMFVLAVGIVLLLVLLVTELPLTAPFFGGMDVEFQSFRLSFVGG
jgi:hypothetical protein